MKKLSFLHSAMAALMLVAAFTSCSKDDDNSSSNPDEPPVGVHYDLIATVPGESGKIHGGMSKDKSHIELSMASLDDASATITFNGQGAEITDYTIESIYKGKYMYQVPNNKTCFSKLQFKDNKMEVIQEQPVVGNTYKARNYTHAWLNDNTLLIMSTDGDHKKVIWTKLNTDDMKIIKEGELSIQVAEGYNVLTTSGVAAYRKSDNKLFYFYYNKKETSGSSKTSNEPYFRIAVINPETMAIEQEIINHEAAQTTASAYGELLQQTVFFDENDNLYISCFNVVSKKNYGCLLRIKKGQFNFEEGYNAFPDAKGKLLTIQYLGNGKALAYSGDNAVGTGINDLAYYYSIVDLNAKSVQRLQYNGADIAYSGGSFSQRSAVNIAEGKAYFGVDTAEELCVYIYDIATGNVTKGIKIADGYGFDQIRLFEN